MQISDIKPNVIVKCPIFPERVKVIAKDFWLYVVFNCASTPEIHLIRDPVKSGWKPLIKIEH